MPCFILCQNCGNTYDSWTENHNCEAPGAYAGFCNDCGKNGTDLKFDSSTNVYSHKDLRECIKSLRDEVNYTESHWLENDSRFCELEKKLSEFIEGRRAAVEATKEKMLQDEVNHFTKT